ncbi:hypothetical protein PRIPAC_90165, partial [Pristionchus pacificus]|uniref:Uncharacterized protein n=1 Tax=Pristionchus pacificus TaxID=54126 RepID=A0A2A6B7I5_PRIPA
AVCERIRQELALVKNVNSLKLCVLGFSRVLMTMGRLILLMVASLAPDDVTSKSRTKTDFDVSSSGANEATMDKISLPSVISILENPKTQSFRELTFLNCARLFRICPILSQTASYHACHERIELEWIFLGFERNS